MKRIVSLLLLMAIITTLVTSCKKKPGPAPDLPPLESMLIDFSNFESGKKSADLFNLPKGVENSNWEFAAFVAGTWNTLIAYTLAVPVAAFKLSIDQTPVYLDDQTWQWSFSVTVLQKKYTARLTGQKRTSDIQWKMYITEEGKSEFLWFEGTSSSSGGQWTLNHSYAFQEPVLQIDYTLSSGAVTMIKYTYIRNLDDSRATDKFKTSYIEYGKTTSNTYNAYYNVYIYHIYLQKFVTVKIEWNTTGHNGRVQCSEYFGNTSWYCWNSNLVNITCP